MLLGAQGDDGQKKMLGYKDLDKDASEGEKFAKRETERLMQSLGLRDLPPEVVQTGASNINIVNDETPEQRARRLALSYDHLGNAGF